MKRIKIYALVLVCIVVSLCGCSKNYYNIFSNNIKTDNKVYSSKFKVHYIDVGQGDSILIQSGEKNMLIDTGTNESQGDLIRYLKKQKVEEINYMVLTHPHEDHIGGADKVIKKFKVDKVYMNSITTNTRTFRDLIYAMRDKGLKANEAHRDSFSLGKARCDIYGPLGTIVGNLNTYSIIVKITYGENKFLFTGDTQSTNENEMINKGYDLSSDVLKIAHHGSRTSSSDEFLNYIDPKYAVISCGKGNDYGHPHKQTVDKLKKRHIPVYRTDENGTIVCTSDGKNIKFSCTPGDYKSGERNYR
ncbi:MULTISPECIES: ComEC/Rec2 family competence protein [Clostridium]|uniref:ComEC/Rec2 family competence protein n=1 Tax=Clostridium TaxID=1485 RepID=UPI00082679B8|nr:MULTISPECIES: ComEC/Rec2 family competence protein [Clostridium]PJI09496.1 MBL fold metallo-hydrolase [Clostridium sp. CT7]